MIASMGRIICRGANLLAQDQIDGNQVCASLPLVQ